MAFNREPPQGDGYIKDKTPTYGWGGSEPTTDKNAGYTPSKPADGVQTTEGSAGAPLWDNIDGQEKPYTDNIAGMSPVSGLMPGSDVCESNWEVTSVKGKGIDYTTINTTPKGQGAAVSLGRWPIQGSALNPWANPAVVPGTGPPAGRSVGDAGLDNTDSWNDSATVGSADSSWKGKGSGEDKGY
jgi:hypothetical protein